MNLNYFTDYSLRVLLYLGIKQERATVPEIARAFGVNQHHLVKVVHRLSTLGWIKSIKGKGGGIELAVACDQLNIGQVVERLEPFEVVECFNPETNTCPIIGICDLEVTLRRAQKAFLQELSRVTLADLMESKWKKEKRAALKLENSGR